MKRTIMKRSMVLFLSLLALFSISACNRHHSSSGSTPASDELSTSGSDTTPYQVYVSTDSVTSSGSDTSGGTGDGTVSGGTDTIGDNGTGGTGGTVTGGTGTTEDGSTGDGTITSGTGSTPIYSGGTLTISSFTLVDIAGRAIGEMLNYPIQLDFANLQNTMEFISSGNAPSGDYNRIRIQFNKQVQLVSAATGSTFSCSFTDYKTNGSDNQPDIVHCDNPDTPDICWIDLNGAIELLANQPCKIGLDFDLKNFIVENPFKDNCTVTMKISPLNAAGIAQLNRPESAAGFVSDVTATSFTLSAGNKAFVIQYSDPDLLSDLQNAQDNNLKVRVKMPAVDFAGQAISATSISVQN